MTRNYRKYQRALRLSEAADTDAAYQHYQALARKYSRLNNKFYN